MSTTFEIEVFKFCELDKMAQDFAYHNFVQKNGQISFEEFKALCENENLFFWKNGEIFIH